MFALRNRKYISTPPSTPQVRLSLSARNHATSSAHALTIYTVGKLIFGGDNKESMIEISQGQLYLVRPLSPKGYSELIFKDAAARIRKTGQEFQYQLVIQRAYEEGEEETEGAEDDEIEAALSGDRDEKTFLLDEALHFRVELSADGSGETVLAWRDLSGDSGDLYQFVCDVSIREEEVDNFELIAKQCQYERKWRRSHTIATQEDLDEFDFTPEYIPAASPIHSTQELSPVQQMPPPPTPAAKTTSTHIANTPAKREMTPKKAKKASPVAKKETPRKEYTVPAAPKASEVTGDVLAKEVCEIMFFDVNSGAFVVQDSDVVATVKEVGKWQYILEVAGKDRVWLETPVEAEINPVFNFEFLSFIFNHYTDDGNAYSWLLRFKSTERITAFQEGVMQALWEKLNEMKWAKQKQEDQDYVTQAFQDLAMEDVDDVREAEQEEEEEEEEYESEVDESDDQKSEHYDSDESDDDVNLKDDDGNVNSQLAVGYKHDRSFVVRGSKIGVFKHTPNNQLEFSTQISKVQTPKGKLFNPKKVMLHAEDTGLIMQGDDPNTLYRMDLERGQIVDEWKVHDDISVNTFAPENKFAQMTGTQTFLGLSSNALYRIDPRLAGTKLAGDTLKQYASKNDFSAAATTEKGYIAVASNKGDVRLFDRLGINAKTHIPALGDAIIGLDVSADGRYVLATCKTYLLLVDTMQTKGKNEGRLGFEKSFSKDDKPTPKRLGLTPNHVAQFQHETGVPISFTPAKFNTGKDEKETSIISATGPFIVTWNMKKVLRGTKDPYTIKRYAEEVKADNFRYGSDKNVIVALPNEVNMVAKKQFRKPTRESIMAPPATPRRSQGRIGKLRRDDIVNSPY